MLVGRPFIAWPLYKDDRLHMAQEKGRLFAPAFRRFGVFYDGSKANAGHYKMTLRNHFVVKTGCHEKS